MCKWGTETILEVTIPAHLSHTGVERQAAKGVDFCIAGIVQVLNAGGVETVASCCGHGNQDGEIYLADGRILIIKGVAKMTYQVAIMGFNGDYVVKGERFENTDDALDFGADDTAPFVLVVDQGNVVVRTRGDLTRLEGHTVEDLSARFAEGIR